MVWLLLATLTPTPVTLPGNSYWLLRDWMYMQAWVATIRKQILYDHENDLMLLPNNAHPTFVQVELH